ncbi:chitin synthase chs-1-like [Clavelina lepadiformis]|uniref:chitin synthase chs-1-like n=1 Tax=Clavelina lepadiformis TaxID=159417 RepID=UPI004041CD6D
MTLHFPNPKDVKELDGVLKDLDLERDVDSNFKFDGNSFFQSVVIQLDDKRVKYTHTSARAQTIIYLSNNQNIGDVRWINAVESDETENEYLERNVCFGVVPDDVMIQAAATALECAITIVTLDYNIRVVPSDEETCEIVIARIGDSHYVPLNQISDEVFKAAYQPLVISEQKQRGILKRKRQGTRTGAVKKVEVGGIQTYKVETQHVQAYEDVLISRPENTALEYDYEESDPEEQEDQNETVYSNADSDYYQTLLDDDVKESPDQIHPCDQFKTVPIKRKWRETGFVTEVFLRFFKLFSYFVFGGLVLTGALISKTCLMILANSAKPCNELNEACGNLGERSRKTNDAIRSWSYIILLLMILIPEVMTMIYCLFRLVGTGDRRKKKLGYNVFVCGIIWEFLHAVGEGILILKVLPYMDSTVAFLMMPLVAVVPIFINIHTKYLSLRHNSSTSMTSDRYKRPWHFALSLIAACLQIGGLFCCFLHFFIDGWFDFLNTNYTYAWLCIGIILTSIRYWENFASSDLYIFKFLKVPLLDHHEKLEDHRFFTTLVYSLVKCLVLIGMTFLVFVVLESDTYSSEYITDEKGEAISSKYTRIFSLLTFDKGSPIVEELWYVFAVQVCCSFAAFFFGRVSCITMIQRESYTFPLVLVTPVLVAISAALGTYKKNASKNEGCLLHFFGISKICREISHRTYYLDWNNILCSDCNTNTNNFYLYMLVLGVVGLLLGWLALFLVTLYLWRQNENKGELARIDDLFVKPLFGGALIDQVLMVNRRQLKAEKEDTDNKKTKKRRLTVNPGKNKKPPHLFLCATMWHENKKEMDQILTSILRFDSDQAAKRSGQEKAKFYNSQVHIVFDDAFEKAPSSKKGFTTNEFVDRLCDLIDEATNDEDKHIMPPLVYPTPYGGKLEYTLPNATPMVVHLKNKTKIRKGKRWSQCMYMYYIFGYLCATTNQYDINNIFLLTLDGDVDFKPTAVSDLMDRMEKNDDVGAVCGRIHPRGTGPVVWFQKFEYAVGHWLQKTAEHVLGCVFCSPGCFSLYRGKALVADNVIRKYVTKSTKAVHRVQWDQGEDRWLCTLLLKQGSKIEYCAASDSFTFSPESFNELYNQRKRWVPSTLANILDIFMNARSVVRQNKYISWGYLAYQIFLMIASVLGPATVIMIVQGAYQYVFHWSATISLLASLIPVVIFIIICYTTSTKTQLLVALVLTIIYALVMMSVVVGVVGSMVSTVIFSPNNLFMIMLVALYAFTGILHPREMSCLIHGILYYLCVPSAFIFLLVYSLNNMNDISWGTREKPKMRPIAEQNEKEQQANRLRKFYEALSGYNKSHNSCGWSCMCHCPFQMQRGSTFQAVPQNDRPERRKPRRSTIVQPELGSGSKQHSLASGNATSEKSRHLSLGQLRRAHEKLNAEVRPLSTSRFRKLSKAHLKKIQRGLQSDLPDRPSEMLEQVRQLSKELQGERDKLAAGGDEDERDEIIYWIPWSNLPDDAESGLLDNSERDFWKYMIDTYLAPEDKEGESNVKVKELKDLRNGMTGAYYLANALWLSLNYALQLAITDIAIILRIGGSNVAVNPVQFAFLIFFLVILLIQFICMLSHRWSTALHLLSNTSLKCNGCRNELHKTSVDNDNEETAQEPTDEYLGDIDLEFGADSSKNVVTFSTGQPNLAYDDTDHEQGEENTYDRLHMTTPASRDLGTTLRNLGEFEENKSEGDEKTSDEESIELQHLNPSEEYSGDEIQYQNHEVQVHQAWGENPNPRKHRRGTVEKPPIYTDIRKNSTTF